MAFVAIPTGATEWCWLADFALVDMQNMTSHSSQYHNPFLATTRSFLQQLSFLTCLGDWCGPLESLSSQPMRNNDHITPQHTASLCRQLYPTGPVRLKTICGRTRPAISYKCMNFTEKTVLPCSTFKLLCGYREGLDLPNGKGGNCRHILSVAQW